jgi:hypothetical protein
MRCSLLPGGWLGFPLQFLLCVGCAWLLLTGPSAAQGAVPSAGGASGFELCHTLADAAARLRCYEDHTPEARGAADPQQPNLEGDWRLLLTPNPQGGQDAVSIVHTADITRSDLGLAGIMFRCSDGALEGLLVVTSPFPPSAHPTVAIDVKGERTEYAAKIVRPGALLLLPADVVKLAAGPWQEATELSVTVVDKQGLIRGIIPLKGLRVALQVLRLNCPAQ